MFLLGASFAYYIVVPVGFDFLIAFGGLIVQFQLPFSPSASRLVCVLVSCVAVSSFSFSFGGLGVCQVRRR